MRKITKLLLIIIFSQVLVITFFALGKEDLFLDEIFSYNLANGVFFFDASHLFSTKLTTEYWINAFAVSDNKVLDFSNVWANQALDVHPPFYYALLHIVGSLTPGEVSVLSGISLNLFFFVLTQIVVFLISKNLLKNDFETIMPMLFYGISLASLSTVLIVRMYMMLTFFVLLSVLLHIKLIDNHVDKPRWIWFAIFLTHVVGFLTNYYYLISAVAIALPLLIYWIFKKYFFKVVSYLFCSFISILICISIFPALLRHIFFGYRGKEAFVNLAEGDFFSKVNRFFEVFSNQVCINFYITLLIVICLIVIIRKFIYIQVVPQTGNLGSYKIIFSRKIYPEKRIVLEVDILFYRWLIVVLAVIVPFFVIAKIAPYVQARYVSPQFPLTVILGVGVFVYLLKTIKNKKVAVAIVSLFLAYFCFYSWDKNKIVWYGVGHTSFQKVIDSHPNTTCIGITNKKRWSRLITQGYRFSKCKQSYFFTNLETQLSIIPEDERRFIVLWIDSDLHKNRVQILKNIMTTFRLSGHRLLFNDYGNIYFLN